MKKLALISVSLVTIAGVAAAQTPPAKAPAPPAAKAPAPPAKGAPAVPADKAAPPAADKAAAPTVPPKPVGPPQELKDMAKGMAGTWKCTGQAEVMNQMIDVKATITHRTDATLGGFWVNTSFVGTAPKLPPMKSTWYTTYNPNSKKLYRVMVNARGGVGWSWGTMADKKTTWEGESHWPDGTDVKTRGTEEMISPKEIHATGEYSKDGGKTWNKDHDATCKK